MSLPNLSNIIGNAVKAVELSHSERSMTSSSSTAVFEGSSHSVSRYRILNFVSPLYENIFIVESENDPDSIYVVKKLPSPPHRIASVFSEGAIQRFLSDEVVSKRHGASNNVVRFVDHYFETTHLRSNYCIVMEYCSLGSVHQFIENYQSLISREVSIGFTKDIVNGIHYMHSLGIAHRDIKLENLLLAYNHAENRYVVKIGDFGFARYVYSDKTREIAICGSIHYLSPEIFRKEERHPFVSDIWAMGVCIYALFEFCYPFDYGDTLITQEAVDIGRKIFSEPCFILPFPKMKDNLGFINLITNILSPFQLTRFRAEECMDHYFIKFARHQELTPQMIKRYDEIYDEIRDTTSETESF